MAGVCEVKTVRVAGASFDYGEAKSCCALDRGGADYMVALGHFLVGPQDGTLYGTPVFSAEYLAANGHADMYVTGDCHEDYGVSTVGTSPGRIVRLVAPGSISYVGERLASTRRPAAAHIVISASVGASVRVLRPKVPALVDLVDAVKHDQMIAESAALDSFVSALSESEVSGGDPVSILSGMQLAEQIKVKVQHYLSLAESAR
jgi:hypothetical protein